MAWRRGRGRRGPSAGAAPDGLSGLGVLGTSLGVHTGSARQQRPRANTRYSRRPATARQGKRAAAVVVPSRREGPSSSSPTDDLRASPRRRAGGSVPAASPRPAPLPSPAQHSPRYSRAQRSVHSSGGTSMFGAPTPEASLAMHGADAWFNRSSVSAVSTALSASGGLSSRDLAPPSPVHAVSGRMSPARLSADFRRRLDHSAARIQRWWRARRAQEQALAQAKLELLHKARARQAAASPLPIRRSPQHIAPDPELEAEEGSGEDGAGAEPAMRPLPEVEEYSFASKLERLKAAAARRRQRDRLGAAEEAGLPHEAAPLATASPPSSASSPSPPSAPPAGADSPPPPSEGKVASIYSFLDEVESTHQDAESDFAIVRRAKALAGQERPVNLGQKKRPRRTRRNGMPATATAAPASKPVGEVAREAHSVTSAIVNQRRALQERAEQLDTLQQDLEARSTALAEEVRVTAQREEAALKAQREESEATISRHLSFIDQLIGDKKELSGRCEKLVGELKAMEKKSSARIKALQESRELDLKRQKEIMLASEKTKRDRWLAEHSKRIKEQTVKGLEPEIQRLVQEHKAALQQLRDDHALELRRAGGDQNEQHMREVEELRSRLRREVDDAIDRTREEARQRHQRMLEEEQKEHHNQRRELHAELQAERSRNLKQLAQDRAALEAELQATREADARTTAGLREDLERDMANQQRRHEAEMRALKEQLAIEKEGWEDVYHRKHEAIAKAKEEDVRERLRQERDREIDMVIDRLEAESAKTYKEMEAQLEVRMGRHRETAEARLRDAEQSEQATARRHAECKERLAAATEELATLRGSLAQRGRELEGLRADHARLSEERSNVAEVVRVEFGDRLTAGELELEGLRRELSDLKTLHRQELSEVQRDKDAELDHVHSRVRSAIAKKDETIRALRAQFEAAALRADHLETVLDKQRHDLL